MFVAWLLVRGATKELGGGLEPNENGEGDMVEGGCRVGAMVVGNAQFCSPITSWSLHLKG